MRNFKFNGVLQEILEQYPIIDVVEFLQEKLQISVDRAEELAARIENEYCQKDISKSELKSVTTVLEAPSESVISLKTSVYSVDCLSEKEFEHFIKWLFEELGFANQAGKVEVDFGVNFVAAKNCEKVAVHAIRASKNSKVSNSIVLKSQETKGIDGCNRSIIVVASYFTQQAIADAEKLGVELWDKDTVDLKIAEVRKKAELEEQSCFPQYKGSLLESLLGLEETKDFIIEPKADGKYDLHLPGVKYPLLTFQAIDGEVVKCVFRIKYNEPVGEFDGEALISVDRDNERIGPDGAEAYAAVIKYLEQFVE